MYYEINRNATGGVIVDKKRYIYDKVGNIERIYSNGVEKVHYRYDSLNRLIREDNRELNATYVIDYDRSGNIISKQKYPYTISENLDYVSSEVVDYGYRSSGWRDQLMVYNGQSIIYDKIGNPTTYKGKTLSWEYVRQLHKIGENIEYYYNASGIRQKKVVDGVTTEYSVIGDKLLGEKRGDSTIHYIYGVEGLFAFEYNGERYTYIRNLLGDIEYIIDSSLKKVARYVYDAWGNHKVYGIVDGVEDLIYDSKTGVVEGKENQIGNINPMRYRGYYYDIESGLYYLNSRYYDPEVSRFINADDISYLDAESINGLNLYAYCGNNPMMNIDPSGQSLIAMIIAGIIVGAVIGAGTSIVSQGISNGWNNINWIQVGFDSMIGGIGGLFAVSGIGVVGSVIAGGILGFAGSVGDDLINNGMNFAKVDWMKAGFAGLLGMVTGKLSGAGATNAGNIGSTLSKISGFGEKVFSNAFRSASAKVLQSGLKNTLMKSITYAQGLAIAKFSRISLVPTFINELSKAVREVIWKVV